MKSKNVEFVISPGPAHMVGDGFRVHNFIPAHPSLSMHRMSPFIMLDYNAKMYVAPSNKPKGVGVHPHRGFETVTIAYKGKVAHHDSSGGGGIIGEGDVQWMTAASGVLHKEYFEEEFSKKGGEFQMVQLWVNLPAKYKMSPPKYQAILNENMGRVDLENNAGRLEIIAGEYLNAKGPASTFTPIYLITAYLNENGVHNFKLPENYNTGLVVLEGEIEVEGIKASANQFVLMSKEGENFEVKASKESKVLILSGEPINEPIAAHGPFVMNTREELIQAFMDFNEGKFGYLED